MDLDDKKFRQIRRITSQFKHALELLYEIKFDHDKGIEKLDNALFEIQENLRDKGVDIELCHLTSQVIWLDDDRLSLLRKKILDFGNNLRREVEND